MVLYPNKLPESERVCSGICRALFYPNDTALCKSIRPNDIKGYASSGAEFQPVKKIKF